MHGLKLIFLPTVRVKELCGAGNDMVVIGCVVALLKGMPLWCTQLATPTRRREVELQYTNEYKLKSTAFAPISVAMAATRSRN